MGKWSGMFEINYKKNKTECYENIRNPIVFDMQYT